MSDVDRRVKNSKSPYLLFFLKNTTTTTAYKQILLKLVLKHREDHFSSGDTSFMELRKECVKKFRLVGNLTLASAVPVQPALTS